MAMVLHQLRENWEEHPLRTGYRILGVCMAALMCEAFVVCGMGFQPGWANGWPGGISKHVVFAVWATGMLLIMLLTSGAGVLAVVCSHLQQLVRRRSVGWAAFAWLFVVWVVVATVVCFNVFPGIHASIVQEWR
jgi:hypothetical protein